LDITEASGASDSGSNPDRSVIYKETDNFSNLIHTYYKNLELEDFTDKHRKTVKRFLSNYISFCGSDISLNKTIEYLTILKGKHDISTYNKQYFQIKKLLRFSDCTWVNKIPLTKPKCYTPKKVTNEQLGGVLDRFKHDLQITALLMLGSSSGLRAMELYQLNPEDIDIEKRIVYVRSDDNHSVKNQGSIRESYFDNKTQVILKQYLDLCKTNFQHDKLFGHGAITHKMRGSGFLVKDLRHIFSRNATMLGVPSGVIKRLLGHSIKQDILESNYNYMDNKDLHALYDRYFNSVTESHRGLISDNKREGQIV